MRRTLPTLAAVALLTAACGNSGTPASPPSAQRNAMNIDEAKAHYEKITTQVREQVTCDGKALPWKVEEAGGAEPTGPMDDEGNITAYTYRGPFLTAKVSCNQAAGDFDTLVSQVTDILEANGEVADTQQLADGLGTDGAEYRWLDGHGTSFTLSSGAWTSFSFVSEKEFPRD